MRQSDHYSGLHFDLAHPILYPEEQRRQDQQDVHEALGMLNDERLLNILQQPTYRIKTIYFQQNMTACDRSNAVQGRILGCVPGHETRTVQILRDVKPEDFNQTEDQMVIVASLATTRARYIAGLILHEIGHTLINRDWVYQSPEGQRLLRPSVNTPDAMVSPRCRHECEPLVCKEYFPETLVGTLLYPEVQLRRDEEGFQAVIALLDSLQI